MNYIRRRSNSTKVEVQYPEGPTTSATHIAAKRHRKPWVYQSEYDKLKDKRDIIAAWGFTGWLILILYVTFDVLT